MSAIIPAVVYEMHRARSLIIDAYNAADAAVRTRLSIHHVSEKGMMAENLLALEKIVAGPQYSKTEKKRVDALVAELREFQPLRCDVVHGRMSIVTVDDNACAMFSKVQKIRSLGRSCLLLTLPEMQRGADRLEAISSELSQPPLV